MSSILNQIGDPLADPTSEPQYDDPMWEFKSLRKRLGWSQREAARQIGTSASSVNAHECGQRDNMTRLFTLAMRDLVRHPEDRLPVEDN